MTVCLQSRSSSNLTTVMHVVLVLFMSLKSSYTALVAQEKYSMNLASHCNAIGKLDMPRGQTTYINGRAAPGSRGHEAASCRLEFGPQTSGDTLEVSLMSNSYIENCESSLSITMNRENKMSRLQCNGLDGSPFPFEAQDGVAVIKFVRPRIDVTDYQFQVTVKAVRTVDKGPPGGGSSSVDVGMVVGVIAGVVVLIVICCVICICCWRRRRETLQEKRQFINGGAAGIEGVVVAGSEKNGILSEGIYPEPLGSNRRLLGRREGSSEDGGDSADGRNRSALERFGPTPSRRRQQVGPNEGEREGRREAFQTENEVNERRRQPQPLRSGGRTQDYENVGGNEDYRKPPESPLLSDLHSNPRFRRSFRENEADADDRARRLSDHTSSGESQDSRDYGEGRMRRPHLPRVPRSPSRSPSPQRRGEKIAAIYRARPSSSVDAARLDSDRSEETPPIEERDARDTRHVLRPTRDGRGQPVRGKSQCDDDYEEEVEGKRRRQQRRRDGEDAERWRKKRQEEKEEEEEREEEERRRKQEKRRKEEERQRREDEEEREEKERRRQETKRTEEERRRREKEEERKEARKIRKSAKESDGSEYEGRFKKSTSGRKSKGKGPRMGRSHSTGNALEDLDERYQRSRSKSPGSAHSLNFIEGDEDETDLDSNYLPFRRAGSKTSLYASRSSLYGRRRKNSMGETVSVSSRTALDDTDSRMGDFDRSRMSQTELRRLFKSTGELEMRPESAQVVRDMGTSTSHGGSATVYGRKTQAKSRHRKRYSRGTQTPQSRGGRERRDSVGSAKSGRSTGNRHKLRSRSRSRESLGGRSSRSRSRGLSDGEDEASDDSSDVRSRKSGRSSHSNQTSKKPSRSGGRRPQSDKEEGSVADDQSTAHSSRASANIYGTATPHPYGSYPDMMPVPGYNQMVYQPVVAPGGPPAAVTHPGIVYQMTAPIVQPQKPPIAPKPKPNPNPNPKPTGSRWDELVNLTDGMKQRRRQMGESVTEDGTESVLSSMWSQPTYNNQIPVGGNQPLLAPPSYTTAKRLVSPDDLSYSSNYPTSSGAAHTAPRNTHMASYSPSESNV